MRRVSRPSKLGMLELSQWDHTSLTVNGIGGIENHGEVSSDFRDILADKLAIGLQFLLTYDRAYKWLSVTSPFNKVIHS